MPVWIAEYWLRFRRWLGIAPDSERPNWGAAVLLLGIGLVAMRWNQVDLEQGLLHVSRLKNGVPSTHRLRGPEIRALRRLRREYGTLPYVFTTERRGTMTVSSVRKIIARVGNEAQLGFPVHPHMLRHACGFKLANEGHDTRAIQHYLGHRKIQHTVRYTELAADRFKRFWTD